MKLDLETQNKLLVEELAYRNTLTRLNEEIQNFNNLHQSNMKKFTDDFCKANEIDTTKVVKIDILSGEMEVKDA
jgi:hypothetical protein